MAGRDIEPSNKCMDVREIYLRVRPRDIAYIKFIIESYEFLGIMRTVDRKEAVIVLLVVPDGSELVRHVLASLANEIPIEEIPRPADLGDDWLINELATDAALDE